MPRKSKMNQQPIIPEVIDLTMTDKAQHELDLEFLKYLEQHAIISKDGYEFKTDDDKAVFHLKYTETLNRIRDVYGLSPIELSKSSLEREPLGEIKPVKKRGRKPKQSKVENPALEVQCDKGISATFEVDTTPNHMVVEGASFESINQTQLNRITNEIAKSIRTLDKIINMISAISSKL